MNGLQNICSTVVHSHNVTKLTLKIIIKIIFAKFDMTASEDKARDR